MKAKDIVVGGRYVAKVSGKSTTVCVDAIRTANRRRYGPFCESKLVDVTVYDVTNLATGRKLTFRSAAKFRSVAGDPKAAVNRRIREEETS